MAVHSTGSPAAPWMTTARDPMDPTPPDPIPPDPIPRQDAAAGHALAISGLAGLGGAAIMIGILHLLPETAGISSVRQTISEYALTEVGWMFNAAAVAAALSSLAVFFALLLTRQATWRSTGLLVGGLWVAGLLVIVAFPKHNWAIGPSANGQIHRIASVVAFLSLPIAVMLLTRRRARAAPTGRGLARAAFWLGAASLAWFSPLIVAMLMAPRTGTPWFRAIPLGLIERGLVITELAAVVAVGLWALAATRRGVGAVSPSGAAVRSMARSRDPEPSGPAPRRPTG